MGGAEGGIMSFARSRAKIFADDDVKVSFADVAGVDEADDELREIVEFLKNPKKYTTLGGRIPKGVLLVGPPGTGKTLLARAVAGEAKVPFFSLSGSEFVEMFVGVGAARVRDLFRQAEAKAPCIVFIDELDALGKVRMQSPMGGHEEREQTLNQLLAEMDGFDAKKGVIIMAATNRPEVLDPALLRPGRFDRQVLVDKPDVKGREAILRIHVRAVKLAESVDLRVIAARTAGFAGADLANLVNEAALLAARRDKPAVDRSDFDEAIDRVIAGLEKKRAMNPRVRRVVAVPRVRARDRRDRAARIWTRCTRSRSCSAASARSATRCSCRPRIATCSRRASSSVSWPCCSAAGSAEAIVFGEVSTGAQNDLHARDRHRARDGHRVRHERRRRPGQPRRARRATFIDTPFVAGARRLRGRNRAADRRRGQAHHRDGRDRRARGCSRSTGRSSTSCRSGCSRRKSIEGDELREMLGCRRRPDTVSIPTRCRRRYSQ